MECPKCHSINAPEASRCVGCGAELCPDLSRTEAIPSSIANLAVGSTFAGRYRITQEIGKGGMGVVYKAEDVKLKRAVALKFLPWWLTSEETAKERFIHEAQAASALDHTNICTIYEVDETHDGQMFMAMAFCEGETLSKRIERGPLSVAEALDIAIQACDGLAAAHDTGLIHRDIKPANIMVNERGHVKIVDFGLAKLAGQTRLTRAGTTVGTVAYMSPEQARGGDIEARTDIWSLGVVLYEMLTGRLPFGGDSEQAVIHSILNEAPEPPSSRNKKVPAALEGVVLRCLRKNPAERFGTADDLQAELVGLRGDHPSPAISASGRILRPARAGPPAWLASSKHRVLLYLAGAVCAFVGLTLLPRAGPVINLRGVAQRFGVGGLPAGRYVALLPFEVAGGDPETNALADGLIEAQTRKMMWIDGFTDSLWVAPVAEVMSGRVSTPHQASDALGVNLVINGDLELVGDVISLTLDLVDAESGARLKRRVVSDPIANLSTWQDSLPVVIARMLEVPLPADRRSGLSVGCTTVPSAYRSYIIGRGYLCSFGGDQNLAASAAWIGRAIEDDSSFAMAYSALGEVYLREMIATKDTAWAARAATCCARAMAADHRLATPHAVLGHVALERGRPSEAILGLERAVATDSNYADAYTALASAYKQVGRNDLALAALKQAVRARPGSPKSYNALGQFYYAQGEYENAIKPFRVMTDLAPRSPSGYNYVGAAYFELERWPEAEEMFKRVIEIEPRYFAYSNLGTINFYEGRFADAAAMYKKALDMSDDDYKVWGHYAEACYWSPGQKEKAIANFQTAASLAEKQLEKEPCSIAILADLASYFAMMGERAAALAYLDRVLAATPENADVMVRVAETFEGLGDRQRALEWVGKALDGGCPLARIDRYPGLRAIRSDPGFEKIRQLGAS